MTSLVGCWVERMGISSSKKPSKGRNFGALPSATPSTSRRPIAPPSVPLRANFDRLLWSVEVAVDVVTVVGEAFGVATDMIKCGTCVAIDRAPLVFRRGEGGLLTMVLPPFDQRDENCRTRRVPHPARKRKGDMAWDVS